MKSSQVRQTFVDYFKRNGHTHVGSSSLIPENDPTLLFANAGMNQFKNAFLGLEKRDYNKAVTVQKCVRAGGKHNDLENVGFTARHHTFFEMLGNFSFGDYFKKDAIHFAWELLTKDFQIPKEKLYVTVFQNDDEAADIWHKQEGVPRDRIFRLGEKDNFWRMGDTGPCGPCTEIFYDHGPKAGKETDPFKGIVAGEDRFIEIWNLVFMQFFEKAPGVMEPLPKPSVDTGSGLERVVAALQGNPNNYNTDLFIPMIDAACKISGADYIMDNEILSSNAKANEVTSALRVLADHCRSSGFLIADGALPSNEGRGYVLRRIMRRAIRYGRKLSDKSLLPAMTEVLIKEMGGFYPELRGRQDHILKTLREEEARFLQTLDQGTDIFNAEMQKATAKGGKLIPGDVVFKLYDTFGFPVDLTQLMAAEKGLLIDEKGFEAEMERAREKSKASWKGQGMDQSQAHLIKWAQDISASVAATEFTGYKTLADKSTIAALSTESTTVEFLGEGQTGFLITPKTPFYAEGGGQVGDHGIFKTSDAEGDVINCFKQKDYHVHHVLVKKGTLKIKDVIDLTVHNKVRHNTMAHHSATHLLHAALRQVLGTHVTQAGSLVDSSRLRFDFTHSQPVTADEIRQIETLVNDQISESNEVKTEIMAPEAAIKAGAMALFGEKYGDRVRVLTMGDFSVELCGGTHVHNTSEIRMFKIVSEGGVSAGVRRIEAIAGDRAIDYALKALNENQTARTTMGLPNAWAAYNASIEDAGTSAAGDGKSASPSDKSASSSSGKSAGKSVKEENPLVVWAEAKKEEIKNLEKEIKKAKAGSVDLSSHVAGAFEATIAGQKTKLIVAELPLDDRDVLSQTLDQTKAQLQSGVVIFIGEGSGDNFPLLIGVTSDLTAKIKAGQVLKDLTAALGGKGGGRPEFAQGAIAKRDAAAVKAFFQK